MAPKGRVERKDEPLDHAAYLGHSHIFIHTQHTDANNIGTATFLPVQINVVVLSLQASRVCLFLSVVCLTIHRRVIRIVS